MLMNIELNEIQKLEKEIEHLIKHSLEIFSEKEYKKYIKFRDKHYKSCKNGYKHIFELTGTGIGTVIKIKCPFCNEEEDITDMSTW